MEGRNNWKLSKINEYIKPQIQDLWQHYPDKYSPKVHISIPCANVKEIKTEMKILKLAGGADKEYPTYTGIKTRIIPVFSAETMNAQSEQGKIFKLWKAKNTIPYSTFNEIIQKWRFLDKQKCRNSLLADSLQNFFKDFLIIKEKDLLRNLNLHDKRKTTEERINGEENKNIFLKLRILGIWYSRWTKNS